MKKTLTLLLFVLIVAPQWLTAQSTWELSPVEQQLLGVIVAQPEVPVTEVYSEEKTNLISAIKKINGSTGKSTLVISTFMSGCGPCWRFISEMEKAGMTKKYTIIVLYVADEVKKLDEVRKKLATENNLSDYHFYAYDEDRGKSYSISSTTPQFLLIDKNNNLIDQHVGYDIKTKEIDAAMQEVENGKYFEGNTFYFNKFKTNKEDAQYYIEKRTIDTVTELRRYYINQDKGINVLIRKGLYHITKKGIESVDGVYESYYKTGDKMEKMTIKKGDVQQYQAWWRDGKAQQDYSTAGSKSYKKEWNEEGELIGYSSFSNKKAVSKTYYQKGIAYKEIDYSQINEGKTYLLREGYTKLKEKVIKELQSYISDLHLYTRWPIQVTEKEWIVTSNSGLDSKPNNIKIIYWDDIWKTVVDTSGRGNEFYIRLDLFLSSPTYYPTSEYTKSNKDDKYPSIYRYRGYDYEKKDDAKFNYGFIYFAKSEIKNIPAVKKLIELYKELDNSKEIKDYK
jgi:hypothetical protein